MASLTHPPRVPVDKPKELGNICFRVKTHLKSKRDNQPELTYTGYYKKKSIKEKTLTLCQRKARMHDHLFHDPDDVSFKTIEWCEACHGRIEIQNHKSGGYYVETVSE